MKTTLSTLVTRRKSYGNVKIQGRWFDEVQVELIGLVVVAVQVRDGRWFSITEVQAR